MRWTKRTKYLIFNLYIIIIIYKYIIELLPRCAANTKSKWRSSESRSKLACIMPSRDGIRWSQMTRCCAAAPMRLQHSIVNTLLLLIDISLESVTPVRRSTASARQRVIWQIVYSEGLPPLDEPLLRCFPLLMTNDSYDRWQFMKLSSLAPFLLAYDGSYPPPRSNLAASCITARRPGCYGSHFLTNEVI